MQMKMWSPKTFERNVRKAAVEYMAMRTCMKPKAIDDFIVKHGLDAQAMVEDFDRNYHRHDLVTAIAGNSDNPYASTLISKYQKQII